MIIQVFKLFKESIVRDITTFGGFPFYAVLTLFMFLVEGFNKTVINLLIAAVLTTTIAVLIRSIYFKPRPKQLPKDTWVKKIEASSFPSVHATRASYLLFLFGNYFNTIPIWILLALAAFGICYSRIHLKRHDVYDLTAGFVLGTLIYYSISFIL